MNTALKRKKFLSLMVVLMVLLGATTAYAATFSAGNTQWGLILNTGTPSVATCSASSDKMVGVLVVVQYDIHNLAGGTETDYAYGEGSGMGSATGTAYPLGILTGAKAWGSINGTVHGPIGYGFFEL